MTSQQISGFFSRLSAKKRLEVTAADNRGKASEISEVDMESVEKDEISAEAESHLSAVCANVMRDVAIQHPIVSFDLNICELVQKRTLTTIRVDRLRDMCIDLGLDISDISPQKRTKPLVYVYFSSGEMDSSICIPSTPSALASFEYTENRLTQR